MDVKTDASLCCILSCREKGGKAWIAFKKYGWCCYLLVLKLVLLQKLLTFLDLMYSSVNLTVVRYTLL